MNPPITHRGTVRFGPFEVDFQSGLVRKRGVRIKLQTQPLAVLQALLEKPGAVVTREELRQTLWPNDTFVDFEHGLNAAVSRLRRTLGDAGGRSRYIETVSKRGYRFAAELELPASVEREEPIPVAPRAGRRGAPVIAILFVLLVTAAIFYIAFSRRKPSPYNRLALRGTSFTTFPGSELDPALSPDGNSVAFCWNGDKEDNFDIYVLRIGSNTPQRLTTNAADDFAPAWSPDGRMIAFSRAMADDRAELVVVPASGGSELKLAQTRNQDNRPAPVGRRMPSVAWTPDGRWIAASHSEPDDAHDRIYLFSLTGGKRALTVPPEAYQGDYMPSFSLDGRALVFCRLSGFSASEVYLQPLGTDLQASGMPRMLTSHNRWATNPVWVRNGRNILYILGERPDAALRRELRMIDASGVRVSERTIPLAEPAYQMTAGRRLVYSVLTREANIWRAKIPDPGEPPTTAEVFIASTWPDSAARYSPDGKYIAFVSERSGSPEIYVSSATGSNPRRITSFEGPLIGPPFWSPDGHRLVFHARTHGQGDIHEIPATGGSPVQLTANASDNAMPSYSHDGQSIYFNSSRSGQRQIWKMPAGGGQAVQITSGGGLRPIESADGKTIYYFANAGGSIRQVPSAGGIEAEVVAPVHESAVGIAVTSTGIYYPTPPYSGDDCEIRFFSFASRRSWPIAHIQRPTGWTISVSPDEQYVIFAQMEKPKHDLMLADPFQLP